MNLTGTEELYGYFKKHPQVSTDTRNLPQGCIFFALKGANFNGNTFAQQALKQGAAYAVIDEPQPGEQQGLILFEDVLSALQQLASYHRMQFRKPVLALTGSNGKTTSKELIASVLQQKFNVHFTKGNLNNHIGVPLTLLGLKDYHDYAVIEMGANHQREIELLCSMAKPDYGLITNIGKAHLEGFGGLEGVKKGKGELFDFINANEGVFYCNLNDANVKSIAEGYSKMITYGSTQEADFRGFSSGNGEFLEVKITFPFEKTLVTQLTGDYNTDNVLAAVAIGTESGLSPEEIAKGIAEYAPSNQRSQVIRNGKLTIILDAYNANPASMSAALINLKNNFKGHKYIALGEMRELGEDSPYEHHQVAQLASGINAEWIITVGGLFSGNTNPPFIHFTTSSEAASWLKNNIPTEGTLLIKGSRGSEMEKLMKAFPDQ